MTVIGKSLSFLNPDTIAIIGASTKPEKRGYQAIARLLKDGFPESNIYPINPKAPEILGVKAYPSVLDVDEPIDLALVCTPARSLPSVIEECGKKEIGCVVVLAAGFSETGEEGKAINILASRDYELFSDITNKEDIVQIENKFSPMPIKMFFLRDIFDTYFWL